MNWAILIFTGLWLQLVSTNTTRILENDSTEDRRLEMLVDIITFNVNTNGWKNILFVGRLTDRLYDITKHLQLSFSVIDPVAENLELQNIIPYASKIVIIDCKEFEALEDSLKAAINSPYWNPHAQLILYYHTPATNENARIFFIFWFYMIVNAIIVQYDDSIELLFISYYNPYINENNKFQNMHGCWKTTKVGKPVTSYKQGFVCEEHCHNITLHSKLRALHLGTCIGYNTDYIKYDDITLLGQLQIFGDISKDLREFVMKTNGFEILPFLKINEESDGSYTLDSRDGLVWKTLSELMNFTINFDSCRGIIKKPFNFQLYIELMFSFAERQADLFICPVYQFDLVFVNVDLSCEYKASGVCIISHRASFETVLFDIKLLQQDSTLIIHFVVCFLCIWFLFYIHNVVEGHWSFDQIGKDFINTIRNILSVSLYKPPTQRSFRIFLTISIWCFFILNFGIQAAIVSFFSAYKRGQEVDTFEDVLQKGYAIEALVSPDMILPDTEELYRKVNNRVKPLMNIFECIDRMANDSQRFCLMDCSLGRYLESNKLNEKGFQYLHVARKNKMHSNYLSLVLHKNSPLTARVNKYLRWFVEVGLVQKWEQYIFTKIKDDFPVKPLSLKDMLGIFQCFYLLLGLSSTIFILEVTVTTLIPLRRWSATILTHWRRKRNVKGKLRLEKKAGKIQFDNIPTQTL